MYKILKRVFCIFACGSALIILLPIFIFSSIGILISDWGSLLYKANRIGKDNKLFKMYKFRSMRIDKTANEKSFKADTNRIFGWGRIMRLLKIDELPQLINCLKGDMAIVGPRPASIDQVKEMREGEMARVSCVKPGLTSPASLYDYLYGDSIEDETEYERLVLPTRKALELYYVDHMSPKFDITLIWWTIECIMLKFFGKSNNSLLKKLKSYV